MPLYEYQCENCGDLFEVMQKFSDTPLTSHEKCGGALHRLISAPALQFKGSGWYITDYAKESKAPASGGSAKSDTPAKKESSSSSDSTSSTSSTSSSSSTSTTTTAVSSDKK